MGGAGLCEFLRSSGGTTLTHAPTGAGAGSLPDGALCRRRTAPARSIRRRARPTCAARRAVVVGGRDAVRLLGHVRVRVFLLDSVARGWLFVLSVLLRAETAEGAGLSLLRYESVVLRRR